MTGATKVLQGPVPPIDQRPHTNYYHIVQMSLDKMNGPYIDPDKYAVPVEPPPSGFRPSVATAAFIYEIGVHAENLVYHARAPLGDPMLTWQRMTEVRKFMFPDSRKYTHENRPSFFFFFSLTFFWVCVSPHDRDCQPPSSANSMVRIKPRRIRNARHQR